MPGPLEIAHSLAARASVVVTAFQASIRYGAQHTGIPAVVLASIALVVGWRMLRRTVRWGVQLAFAMTIILTASYFGWLSF